jgi:IPTL-CTERM motif
MRRAIGADPPPTPAGAQATYLGGTGTDEALALAIHPTTGDVYVAGITSSSNFPDTAGGAQPASGGATDGFVARLTSSLALVDPALPIPTLSEWAMFAMIGLLLMTGLLALRRHRRAH